jgi:transposase
MFDSSVRVGRHDRDMEKEALETLIGRGLSLKSIGARFGVHPSTVGYWVKKHGLSAAHGDAHAARGGLERRALEVLIEAGGTHRSIADELGVSVSTVRHWLARFRLETQATASRRESGAAKAASKISIQRECGTHGRTRFTLHTGGTYRCVRCRAEAVARRRRAVRAAIIAEAGGRCVLCGYDLYVGALQFHHVDPRGKHFSLSGRGLTRSLERLREEAKKCVLLCANCHAEVEGGARPLSLEFRQSLKAPSPGADYPA